jgi:CRISPR-associated endonuclease/helicase Cas3
MEGDQITQMDFPTFFESATGFGPFPYQVQAACDDTLPSFIIVPTGSGKTATVVLGWLWRLICANSRTRDSTPRRLVYCLPMRSLVDQTCREVKKWLGSLGLSSRIGVQVLMGGEDQGDWYARPEKESSGLRTCSSREP